jgi:hypothetical protein
MPTVFFLTLPVTMLAQAAWLLGESRAYTEHFLFKAATD